MTVRIIHSGEISRIVGNEWRSLPAATKQSWEERAARCNEETSARLADEMRELSQHVSSQYHINVERRKTDV